MSGRDLKNLIKQHRNSLSLTAEPNHKTLSKLIDKKPLVKYKTVDYDAQKEMINEQKEVVDSSLARVKQIEEKSKQKRNGLIMKCHTHLWIREWYKLISQLRSCEQELADYSTLFVSNSVDYIDLERLESPNMSSSENSGEQIDDLEHFGQLLDDDRIKFKVKTVCPVDDLGEDVRFYVRKIKSGDCLNSESQHRRVAETIESVKQQQMRILEQLDSECFRLNHEVNEFADRLSQEEIVRGIPIEAFELDCPNEELKISVLQEFIIIDFKYEEKLNQLKESYKSQVEKGTNNVLGWSEREHEMFQHIRDQYDTTVSSSQLPPDVSMRDLMLDHVKRVLKCAATIRRGELVKQEDWSETRRMYVEQRRLVEREWAATKRALVLKAEAVFAEAFEQVEREHERQRERDRQRRVCEALYEKVSEWRARKLEALECEQRLARMQQRRRAERERLERERRHEKSKRDKQAVAEYNEKLEVERQRMEREEREKLEKLKQNLNEQSMKDRERVDYRNQLLLKKREKITSEKTAKKLEGEEKEKKLEKFFDSVKPNVESDPIRAISYTESTLNRRGLRKTNENDLVNECKDQKQIYTFTDKQINADARLRIEQRLREAGLINSDYAREIINDFGLAKHQQFRRDLNANSAWDGFSIK